MIKARFITKTRLDVRSSGDRRRRVDSYCVSYDCPADKHNADPHEWVCMFEVPRGAKFEMRDYPTKADASAAKGYTI